MTDKVLQLALKRFKLAEDEEAETRRLSLADLKFRDGQQWDAEIAKGRAAERRPCLTINRMPEFIRHVVNDIRMNRPMIRVSATDESTEETAEILEGMVRHIQVNSNADVAYDTAVESQVTIGFGYIRVSTDYCDDEGFDQDILIKPVKNPFTVYFDPACVEPDYSDARWCFVATDMRREDFEAEYGEENVTSNIISSVGDTPAGWGNEKNIRVVEYFEVIETAAKIYLLVDGSTVESDENIPPEMIKKKRDTVKRKIIWRKMTADKILETKEWVGKYIPIVPVLGDDLIIDGKRSLKGMVRDAQDPARMYSYWVTAQTEAIALAPRAPFIIAEGQLEGYEKFWNSANTTNHAYLPYKPTSLAGALIGAPQRNQAEPPIQAMSMAIAQASEDLKNVTGIHDASLGMRSNETSGKAITQRQKQGELSNFHYSDNFSRSLRYLGVILLDLIPKIYDRPRITRIVHEDMTSEVVKINQPSGEQDASGIDKIYDVTTGKYDVVVSTGPSFLTKRQEMVDSMVQITQANPELWQVAGDLLVKNMDWNGAQEIAERLKKMLPPQLQDAPDGKQPIPPQVQQQLDQSHTMIDQLTKALNQAHDEADNKKAELESRERIANSNNETKLVIEAFKSESTANHTLLLTEIQGIKERQNLLHANTPIENGGAALPVVGPQQNVDNM